MMTEDDIYTDYIEKRIKIHNLAELIRRDPMQYQRLLRKPLTLQQSYAENSVSVTTLTRKIREIYAQIVILLELFRIHHNTRKLYEKDYKDYVSLLQIAEMLSDVRDTWDTEMEISTTTCISLVLPDITQFAQYILSRYGHRLPSYIEFSNQALLQMTSGKDIDEESKEFKRTNSRRKTLNLQRLPISNVDERKEVQYRRWSKCSMTNSLNESTSSSLTTTQRGSLLNSKKLFRNREVIMSKKAPLSKSRDVSTYKLPPPPLPPLLSTRISHTSISHVKSVLISPRRKPIAERNQSTTTTVLVMATPTKKKQGQGQMDIIPDTPTK